MGILGICQSYNSQWFTTVENSIGKIIWKLSEDILDENLLEETKFTMTKKNINFEEWLCRDPRDRQRIELDVSFDMGWQKRSLGTSYDSYFGHAFLIGAETRNAICFLVCVPKLALSVKRLPWTKEKQHHMIVPSIMKVSARGWRRMQGYSS